MRNIADAVRINSAAQKILEVLKGCDYTEEELRDIMKSVEVSLGIKPPMPPHHPHIQPCPPMMTPHHPRMDIKDLKMPHVEHNLGSMVSHKDIDNL